MLGIVATRGHISLWGDKQLPSIWIADHDFRSLLSCIILLHGTVLRAFDISVNNLDL
jgi:hypothetical protein